MAGDVDAECDAGWRTASWSSAHCMGGVNLVLCFGCACGVSSQKPCAPRDLKLFLFECRPRSGRLGLALALEPMVVLLWQWLELIPGVFRRCFRTRYCHLATPSVSFCTKTCPSLERPFWGVSGSLWKSGEGEGALSWQTSA